MCAWHFRVAYFILIKSSLSKLRFFLLEQDKYTLSFQSIEIDKKFFLAFDNVFHVYLMRGLQKNEKWFFSVAFFLIHFIRFEIHMDRPDKSENTFGTSHKLSKHSTFYGSPLIFHQKGLKTNICLFSVRWVVTFPSQLKTEI